MTRIEPSPRRSILRWWGVAVAGSLAAGALAAQWAGAQEAARRRTAEPDLSSLEKKLEQVLANQDEIMKRLEVMTQELQVVKVRCTR